MIFNMIKRAKELFYDSDNNYRKITTADNVQDALDDTGEFLHSLMIDVKNPTKAGLSSADTSSKMTKGGFTDLVIDTNYSVSDYKLKFRSYQGTDEFEGRNTRGSQYADVAIYKYCVVYRAIQGNSQGKWQLQCRIYYLEDTSYYVRWKPVVEVYDY